AAPSGSSERCRSRLSSKLRREALGIGCDVLRAQALGRLDQRQVTPPDREALKLDAEDAGASATGRLRPSCRAPLPCGRRRHAAGLEEATMVEPRVLSLADLCDASDQLRHVGLVHGRADVAPIADGCGEA